MIGVWLAVTYQQRGSGAERFRDVSARLSYRLLNLITQPAGREDLSGSAALTVVLVVTAAVLLLPWLSGARFSRRPERWLPFVARACSCFSCRPHYVLGTAYFYERLGLIPRAVVANGVGRPAIEGGDRAACDTAVVLWVVTGLGRFAAFARETESFTALVERDGSRPPRGRDGVRHPVPRCLGCRSI